MKNCSLRMPSSVMAGTGSAAGLTDIINTVSARHIALFCDKGVAASGLLEAVARKIPASYDTYLDIPPEPDYHQVESLLGQVAARGADLIVALGGGSVMDAAKLVSVLLGAEYSIRDLLEDPSKACKKVPTVMIPTTCGTGSEATCNAIVLVPEEGVKVGIVNNAMIPDHVILDADMIRLLPSRIVASTGLDALCHAIECYTGLKANPLSDLYALEAMRLIFPSIERAVKEPEAMDAKENMLLAAFYGGVAITSSGTTAVHALSYPLGGRHHIAHGVSNAMLLAPVMRFNMPACTDRLAQIHDAVFPNDSALSPHRKAEAVVSRLEEIVRALDIPSLSSFGISADELASLAQAGLEVRRLMVNNPRVMTLDEAIAIYKEAL